MRKTSFLEKFAAVPHIVWILLFVVAPLIFVAYFAFTDTYGNFTFDNITMLSSYAHIFLLSVCFALIATAICILIGYPLAFFISQLNPKTQKVLVILLMLPMWISLLIRTYSLMAILDNGGLLNSLLEQIGLAKVKIVGTSGAVILGMFMTFFLIWFCRYTQRFQSSTRDILKRRQTSVAAGRKRFSRLLSRSPSPALFRE